MNNVNFKIEQVGEVKRLFPKTLFIGLYLRYSKRCSWGEHTESLMMNNLLQM